MGTIDRTEVADGATVPDRDGIRCPPETNLVIRVPAQFLIQIVQQVRAFTGAETIDRLNESRTEEQRPFTGFRMYAHQRMQRRERTGGAAIEPRWRWFALGGIVKIMVNSLHSQAIDQPAPGLVVEAVAEDETIEAVFGADTPGFVLGLQWHPEWRYFEHRASIAIFRAFGEACRAHQYRHSAVYQSAALCP
jgi:gamma-glutamyl-gamma-aminobutyrate hydrolase PuuD